MENNHNIFLKIAGSINVVGLLTLLIAIPYPNIMGPSMAAGWILFPLLFLTAPIHTAVSLLRIKNLDVIDKIYLTFSLILILVGGYFFFIPN